jgi:hypothetical protein
MWMYLVVVVMVPERQKNMNSALVSANLTPKPVEDFSTVIFSRVIYDHNLPVMQLMSMTEAVRLRRGDVLKLNMLTEKAKKTLGKISGR